MRVAAYMLAAVIALTVMVVLVAYTIALMLIDVYHRLF